MAKPKSCAESKANPLTKGKARRGGKSGAEFVREASAILDEMERNPPSKESLAPFRTKNWIRKGEGMLQGLKPIAVVVLLVLGGCAPGWLADWAPDQSPHSSTYVPGQGIVRTYHYGTTPRDPLGSVHEFRPDIYRRFYGPR
ncbi:MAG: hypothetical protein O6829_00825 [Alphaproteobacteria bacterium]|nr:hypothetical protein [Alphaproteobacteria bacterium]